MLHPCICYPLVGFNTQPPEGGCNSIFFSSSAPHSFNTQPPEGGCRIHCLLMNGCRRFNTQPPEGGCPHNVVCSCREVAVSTHSRPKAAAQRDRQDRYNILSFNTQPPEGGCRICAWNDKPYLVSTHSRPKAAA